MPTLRRPEYAGYAASPMGSAVAGLCRSVTTAATSAGVEAVSARCSVLSFMGCFGAEGQAPV